MRAAAIVAFVLFCAPCQAYFITGNDLVQRMEAERRLTQGSGRDADGYDAGLYVGFVVGVYDMLVLNQTICLDESQVTIGQVAAIVRKFLEENPELWSREGRALVVMALSRAFPCAPPAN